MEKVSIDPKKYVVFDVETNGLKSKEDDLMSISFFKPDDGKTYNRFLPLELSCVVKTTKYNGITEEMLKDKLPLTQEEFDEVIKEFELDKRTILTFSGRNFDEVFLREYLHRKKILGFDRLKFKNLKKQIITSRYSGGEASKDNLCKMFNIPKVSKIHTGINDCILEWELFKKLGESYYLVMEGIYKYDVFKLNPDYIIPVSYLQKYPNLSKLLKDRQYVVCESNEIYNLEIDAHDLDKFQTNISGMTIEHLIYSMLNVQKQDSKPFLTENKQKLEWIGEIPDTLGTIFMDFNSDGTVTAIGEENKTIEKEINKVNNHLKERIVPLIEYIKNDIFNMKPIMSQELVIDREQNILALCDLSSEDTVLEIKTNNKRTDEYKEQIFYESNGRKCYHLSMEWKYVDGIVERIIFHVFNVNVGIGNAPERWTDESRKRTWEKTSERLQARIKSKKIKIIDFVGSTSPIIVECLKCGNIWKTSYSTITASSFKCRDCHKRRKAEIDRKRRSEKKKNSEYITKPHKSFNSDERLKKMEKNLNEKVLDISGGTIEVSNYIGAKYNVTATCKKCMYSWQIRPDHLIDRCYCRKCKNKDSSYQ